MYEQVEKPKENKSRAVGNSVAQKKRKMKQGFGFVDNRPEAVAQHKRRELDHNNTQNKPAAQFLSITGNCTSQQLVGEHLSLHKKGVTQGTDTAQLMRDGLALRGPIGTPGTAHPTLNNANFAFATVDPAGQRTPSLYFNTPAGHVRMRTQHGHGPALTTPTNNGQFFFQSRAAMDHWAAHMRGGGTVAGYLGYTDPATGAVSHPTNVPFNGVRHAEISGSGTIHHSGGLTDTTVPPQNDHELNDMTVAVADHRANGTHRDQTINTAQL